MVPDKYLENLDYKKAEDKWSDFLNDDNHNLLIAKDDKENILGFIAGIINKESQVAELYAIYVNISLKGNGLGSKLLSELCKSLRNSDMKKMIVWAMSSNIKTVNYYKYKGAKEYATRKNEFDGQIVEDICLIWEDISLI